MKTCIQLNHRHRFDLPPQFQHDDVRYSDSLVEYFLQHFTQAGDIVFDPFTGFGTTLFVAEAMDRLAYGLEYEQQRVDFVRPLLKRPDHLIRGDARQLLSYNLPTFDFSITSPPFMSKYDEEDPFTAYSSRGKGYQTYLRDLQEIYRQVGQKMKPGSQVVIEAANLKNEAIITTLAWDIGKAVSEVLQFEGEIIVNWEEGYGYGYDHSYCLIFSKPSEERA